MPMYDDYGTSEMNNVNGIKVWRPNRRYDPKNKIPFKNDKDSFIKRFFKKFLKLFD
jgi:hypothetical protein